MPGRSAGRAHREGIRGATLPTPRGCMKHMVAHRAQLVLAAALPANAFGLTTLSSTATRSHNVRRAAVTMAVGSWFDGGVRLATEDAPAPVVVESWYDNGVRLTEEQPFPAGISKAAAAENPELVASALKYEAEIAEIQARLDAFPTKAGTMYGAQLGCGLVLIAEPGIADALSCLRCRRHSEGQAQARRVCAGRNH